MRKTVLFDFDGVIADSFAFLFATYNEIAESKGCKPASQDDMRKYRGMHAKEIVADLGIPLWKLPMLLFSTLSAFKKNIHALPLLPDMKKILQHLQEHGYSLHIISSNAEENIRLFLKNHRITFFHSILSCDAAFFGKEKFIKKFLNKHHQLKPEQVLYIGDEVRDIEAAKANNVKIIAVSWGYNTREKLQEMQPDYLVDKPDDLLHLIEKL